MASIPLPALGVKPVEQPDTLSSIAKLIQLKTAMAQSQQQQALMPGQLQQQQQTLEAGAQENQQRAQQIKDQQAMTAAMQSWDGKDVNSLIPLVVKNGASANAVMGLKAKVLEQQKTYSDMAKNDAETGAKNLESMKQKNDMVLGALNTVKSAPDEQFGQALSSTVQDLVQKGLLDPQHAQVAMQLGGDPVKGKQALDIFEKSLMSQSQQMEQAAKDAALPGIQAESQIKVAEANATQQYGGVSPQMADSKYRFLQQKVAAKQPISADDQTWMKGYEKQKLLVPATTAQIRIEGMGQTRENQVYDNKEHRAILMSSADYNAASKAEPGRYTLPGFTAESLGTKGTTNYFTSGAGGKQLTAFNTAITHLDTLDKLASDLNNTDIQIVNKAKQEWAQQTGSAAPANFEAAKNAMSGEVAAALKASGATDQEIAHVGSTFDRAQSPAQLKGAIATYRTLLNGKRDNLQKQYQQGMQGQPTFNSPASTQNAAPAAGGFNWNDHPVIKP